jgi:hypothetical protein
VFVLSLVVRVRCFSSFSFCSVRFGFVFRRSVWCAISLVLQSNISFFFFFFCILLHEYYSCSTLRRRVQFGCQIKRSRLIVHSHEYLLLRSCLGCILWHYSFLPIDPRYTSTAHINITAIRMKHSELVGRHWKIYKS